MSDSGTGSEPSMEDILASIRRILSDDPEGSGQSDGTATSVSQTGGAGTKESLQQGQTQEAVPDVFELDQSMIVTEGEDAGGPEEASVDIEHNPFAERADVAEEGSPLLDAGVAAAAGASLGALSRLVSQRQMPVYRGGPTLDDLVREELRPLLKTWLDQHLPPLVERLVQAEIERVARSR